MQQTERALALVDLDGTLANYDKAMRESLAKLAGPNEPIWEYSRDNEPDYIYNRQQLIKADPNWWKNLEKFQLGWDVLAVIRELDFDIMVLTQGPRKNANAWKGKVEWCLEHLPDVDIDITRQKSGRYGRVLVDDFPEYIEEWLKTRPRGLVIMPAHPWNKDFEHPQILRYDGTNIEEVRTALMAAKNRAVSRKSDWQIVREMTKKMKEDNAIARKMDTYIDSEECLKDMDIIRKSLEKVKDEEFYFRPEISSEDLHYHPLIMPEMTSQRLRDIIDAVVKSADETNSFQDKKINFSNIVVKKYGLEFLLIHGLGFIHAVRLPTNELYPCKPF